MKTTLARTSIILLILLSACASKSSIQGARTFPNPEDQRGHTDTVTVPEGGIPPAYGAHYPAWQKCGIYDQPVELGNALHSMEHGAVWLTYRPGLSGDQVTELQSIVRGHGFVLLSPYTGQTADVIVTAWGVQLVIESLPDERIAAFIASYENGPQNPEPGAPCSGPNSVGQPLP